MNRMMMSAVCNIVNHNKRPTETWALRVSPNGNMEFYEPRNPNVALVEINDHDFMHFAHLVVDDNANRLAAESEARFTAALTPNVPEPGSRPI